MSRSIPLTRLIPLTHRSASPLTPHTPFTLSEARSAESKGAASLLLILLAACGTAADPPPPDDPEFPPPPDGAGLQLVATVHIDPGAEQLSCRYLVLPDSPLEIARFEHRYTPGSHHLLIYPTDLSPSDVDDEPFDCLTRGDLHATGVLYGGMSPTGDLPYPAGIAMKLPPRSVVLLETHYLNATDAPLDAVARVNLWFSTTPATIEAGTLFFRNWALYLPPAPASGSASMHCALPSSISLLYATSHMHRRGVAFTSTATSPSGSPSPLHDADTWSAPTPTVYWPPLDLPAGTSIDFTCDYVNDLSSPVIEGVSATTDEMCVLVGGYWPKLPASAELCLGPESGPVLSGTETCEQVVGCMLDAGVGNWLGGQQCVANTCAPSASALSSFVVCVNLHNCWGDPGCVAAQCPTEWSACTSAGC